MSQDELSKYMDGKQIIGRRQSATFSGVEGKDVVCFSKADCKSIDDIQYSIYHVYEYMKGCVTEEVCAVFRSSEKHEIVESRYADPYGNFFDTIWVDDFYVPSYSKTTHELIACYRYAEKDWTWIKVEHQGGQQ
jgi:hypothetical protein